MTDLTEISKQLFWIIFAEEIHHVRVLEIACPCTGGHGRGLEDSRGQGGAEMWSRKASVGSASRFEIAQQQHRLSVRPPEGLRLSQAEECFPPQLSRNHLIIAINKLESVFCWSDPFGKFPGVCRNATWRILNIRQHQDGLNPDGSSGLEPARLWILFYLVKYSKFWSFTAMIRQRITGLTTYRGVDLKISEI